MHASSYKATAADTSSHESKSSRLLGIHDGLNCEKVFAGTFYALDYMIVHASQLNYSS